MHLQDGRLVLEVFLLLQAIGTRNTAFEDFVEGQSRHVAIDDVITPVQKIVVPLDAGIAWINQLENGIFLLIVTNVSLECGERESIAFHTGIFIDIAIDQGVQRRSFVRASEMAEGAGDQVTIFGTSKRAECAGDEVIIEASDEM